MLTVVTRSSTPARKGLSVPHGIGIIDQDYCGPNDEVKLQVFNFTNKPVNVDKGERVGQAVFVKVEKAQWNEVNETKKDNRGGFGSTGK
jgi:dUTP pyrophosphatase